MANQRKPSIVFVHGLWADGSCFSKLIPTLLAEGHEVIASQHGLDSHAEDVANVRRTLNRVSSPVVLVGHSYGGSVITAAGTDLPQEEQKLTWATQGAPVADLFNQKVEGTAWKSKPSWHIVATSDHTIQPDLQRFVAKRAGAKTFETNSSHVPMLSQPAFVLDVIRKAAEAVTEKTLTA